MNGDGSTSMGKRGIGGDLSGKPVCEVVVNMIIVFHHEESFSEELRF